MELVVVVEEFGVVSVAVRSDLAGPKMGKTLRVEGRTLDDQTCIKRDGSRNGKRVSIFLIDVEDSKTK